MEEEKSQSRLNEIDRLYGYEEPVAEEDEDENKSISQQMVDALKRKREGAFGKLKDRW